MFQLINEKCAIHYKDKHLISNEEEKKKFVNEMAKEKETNHDKNDIDDS